jgi:pyridoxal phosphate enzyme (YggS family)
MVLMVEVRTNYLNIRARIDEAAAKCGRKAGEIKLLGAVKAQNVQAIRAAINAGVRLIGENYVQEAKEKRDQIAELVEWHMIGHLQRNKAKAAVAIFDVIESLDNFALARELDREGRKRDKAVRVFIEVNLGGEENKSGIKKGEIGALLEEGARLAHLRIEGLMTVPPFHEDVEKVRPYFRELRRLREELSGLGLPNVDLKELSMGMTHDYPIAIEEGATIVRIGTALFGPRSE